jgi:hypothetical protein
MKRLPIVTRILQYGITLVVCLLLCFAYAAVVGLFKDWESVQRVTSWNINNEAAKNLFILTNAFFSVGILCACIGLFILAANGGAFEMLVYGVSRFISLFKRDPSRVRFKTFYDYHVYHSEKQPTPFGFFIVIGALLIATSIILLYFYYQVN